MTISCQILGGVSEDLNDVVLRLQQIGEACPDRLIVIHHEDARFQLFQSLEDVEVFFTQALYDQAKKDGWFVISMKNDWKRIFSFEN
jgi:hypothetical protein